MDKEYYEEISHIDKEVLIKLEDWIEDINYNLKDEMISPQHKEFLIIIKETLLGVNDMINDCIVYNSHFSS